MNESYFEAYEIRTAKELTELENRFKKEGKIVYYRYNYVMANKIIINYEFANVEAQKEKEKIILKDRPLEEHEAIKEAQKTVGKFDAQDAAVIMCRLYEKGYKLTKPEEVKA